MVLKSHSLIILYQKRDLHPNKV